MSSATSGVASPASDGTKVHSESPIKQGGNASGPPALGYSVRQHRTGLIIAMVMLVFLNACAPILVYYPVKHFTNVTNERLYGITTAVLANSPITWPIRAWRLLRRQGERSPVPNNQTGAPSVQRSNPRWWQKFDVFQWQVSGRLKMTTNHADVSHAHSSSLASTL